MSPIVSLTFNKFMTAVHRSKNVKPFVGCLVSLDPGETTGYAVWHVTNHGAELLEQGQLKTWPMSSALMALDELFVRVKPIHVVHETYAVYEWKTDSHAWSQVPTLRIIGMIETLCLQKYITYSDQTAQVAKNFCTDAKLEAWNFYAKGMRHARDAVRHGAYYILFSPS
jgi:hypothetical protein